MNLLSLNYKEKKTNSDELLLRHWEQTTYFQKYDKNIKWSLKFLLVASIDEDAPRKYVCVDPPLGSHGLKKTLNKQCNKELSQTEVEVDETNRWDDRGM